MEIGVKQIVLVMVFLTTQSCSALESDYDKLMNPIKKIKLAEKKMGKANPFFDGVVEPDLPDEKENDKTLEGMDSNHDGVRDDIEIWINRTADDEYVRKSLKLKYKYKLKLFSNIERGVEPHTIAALWSDAISSDVCLGEVVKKYKQKYISSYHVTGDDFYNKNMENLFFNNTLRKNLNKLFEKINIKEPIGNLSKRDDEVCEMIIGRDRYKKIIDSNQEHRR